MPNERTYYVKGMHCASCEITIEKKLLELPSVKAADASTGKGRVVLEYEGMPPNSNDLTRLFANEKYAFSDRPFAPAKAEKPRWFKIFGAALLIALGFIVLNKLGLGRLVNVGPTTSLPMFFVLGIVAGLSSCAALVGGVVLSMGKQWSQLYGEEDSLIKKLEPHFMFNAGRVISYALLGALLGLIGAKLQLSLTVSSVIAVAVAILMLVVALQMLGIRYFQRFQLALPKFITRSVANEKKFKGRSMPLVMGALTFFLPCGFTLSAQSIALLSGSALHGGLIMLAFALGTLPTLLLIGVGSARLSGDQKRSATFTKIAGILLLFFSLYTINSGLNTLGAPSFDDALAKLTWQRDGLPTIVNGKQIVKVTATATAYQPNYLKVKVGVPVRWEIFDGGTSGCTSVFISRALLPNDRIFLKHGETSVREFTIRRPGRFKFSCAMGMVTGVMEAVE